MSNSDQHSVTAQLSKLKLGDENAAFVIWERFFERIRGLAKAKLGSMPKRHADEEDIALSAINALYDGARADRFRKLEDRDDLWQILCMITARKTASAWRKKKARPEIGESAFGNPGDDDQQFNEAESFHFYLSGSCRFLQLNSLSKKDGYMKKQFSSN